MQDATPSLIGKMLGTCVLEKLIGQGGMGEVYLARQTRPDRRVAVKILRSHASINGELHRQFLARFQREANLIAQLEHINIMPIYEYGEQDGLPYLVMPYLTGGSLRDLLMQRGPLDLIQTLRYVEQAAAALDYAHAHSVIHRDLKPANFLLHADGRLILADFGIARILEEEYPTNAGGTLTGTGMLLGTPEYMAPEMVRGEPLDRRADIYELGIVLYQMLSGSLPFKGNTPVVVAAMHLQQPLPSLHACNPKLPVALDAVLQTATAKERSQRFASAGAVVQALHQAIAPTHSLPDFPSTSEPTRLAEHRLVPTPPIQPASTPIPGTLPSMQAAPATVANPQSKPSLTYPHTPYPPLHETQRQANKQPWFVLLALLLTALLVTGGVLIGLQLNRGNLNPPITQVSGQNAPQPGGSTVPTVVSTTSTTHPTTALSPAPTTQANGVPKGQPLYMTNEPGALPGGASCDGGSEDWDNYNSNTTCQAGNVIVHNAQTSMVGLLLKTLPHHAPYPSYNYVVEAQLQQSSASHADFGLYFRNQPGYQAGIYTLLIHPDGSWAAVVYDNVNGNPTTIRSGNTGVDAHARLTLAVVANGPNYTFYINGQQVGQVNDATYLNGTTGVVVDVGGTITVSEFALYSLA